MEEAHMGEACVDVAHVDELHLGDAHIDGAHLDEAQMVDTHKGEARMDKPPADEARDAWDARKWPRCACTKCKCDNRTQ